MIITDPFFLFCLAILFTPLLVKTIQTDEGDDLQLRTFELSVWTTYWADWAVLAGLSFAAPALWYASKHPALPKTDELTANWFLVCAHL